MYEPSANGMASHITRLPEYNGWRTMPYGPVEITLWPTST